MTTLYPKFKIINRKGEEKKIDLPNVVRETLATVTNGKHRGKQLIVELYHPDKLVLRIKGTRQRFETEIGTIYFNLVHSTFHSQLKNTKRKRR